MLEQNTLEAAASEIETHVSEPLAPALPSEQEDVGLLYETYRSLLLFVAARKFRIPESEAENLIQEVFLSYLQVSVRIENVRGWLVAAVCNASRHFWRAQGRTESLPDDIGERCDPSSTAVADRLALEMTVHQSLGYLKPKCRETLHMHYFEGRSAADMAKEMNTTSRYAEKLIHNCLKNVRTIYMQINRVKR